MNDPHAPMNGSPSTVNPGTEKPISPFLHVGGMTWFPRMVNKIRLNAAGRLHPDFHRNLGLGVGGDGICCGFLGVAYEKLVERVLAGGTDEEILEWCQQNGRRLGKVDLFVWNEFVRKFGWNDRATPVLERLKAAGGLAHRSDLTTMMEYMEVDEGRKP